MASSPAAASISVAAQRLSALDGLRAVLVVGVITFHLWADNHDWQLDTGSIAVIGFFALSGYLITGLLLSEYDHAGRVDLRNFFARRALRLLPALGFFLIVWLAVDLLFPHGQFLATVPSSNNAADPVSWITGLESVGAALLYVTNWLNVEPQWHLWAGYSPISHLWTLAVEEQFYLVWAPVMVLLVRLHRRVATQVTASVVVVALCVPVALSSAVFNRVYFGTDTRCAALFCGALGAFIGSRGGWKRLAGSLWAPTVGVGILTTLVWSTYALRHEGQRNLWNAGIIVGSLACSLAVVYVASRPQHLAARVLAHPVLVAVGRRSYALYLWSYVFNTWFRDTGLVEPVLVIGASLFAAEISYRLVEVPALSHRHHFPPAPAPERRLEAEVTPERVLVLDPA